VRGSSSCCRQGSSFICRLTTRWLYFRLSLSLRMVQEMLAASRARLRRLPWHYRLGPAVGPHSSAAGDRGDRGSRGRPASAEGNDADQSTEDHGSVGDRGSEEGQPCPPEAAATVGGVDGGRSTTSSISAAITSPPTSTEPPAPEPATSGPRSPALPPDRHFDLPVSTFSHQVDGAPRASAGDAFSAEQHRPS
jgi:hypothetical protein